jgi:hypothetical protein
MHMGNRNRDDRDPRRSALSVAPSEDSRNPEFFLEKDSRRPHPLKVYRAILGASPNALNDDELTELVGQLRQLARVLVRTAPAARTSNPAPPHRTRAGRKRTTGAT